MKGLGYLSVSFAVLCAATGPSAAETLIVNSYGGPYENIIQESIIKPFQEKFGIEVIYDAAGSAAQDYAKIKATNGQPGFDVNVMTASQSLDGCKDGLLEMFTPEAVPNLAHLDAGVSALAGPCGAIHEIQYMSLLWRTDKLGEVPTSWNDLYRPELKKKVLLPTFTNVMSIYLMQVLSVMNGGSLDDIDPGFRAMVKLAPQAAGFEQSSSIMDKQVRSGEIWALPFWSGRAQLMKDSGTSVDFIVPAEGTIPLIATLNVPVGAENKEAAMKFVNFFLEKSSQEAWVAGYKVGSIRDDLDLSDDIRAKQITTKADIEKLHLPNLQMIAEKQKEWGARWQREVLPAAD